MKQLSFIVMLILTCNLVLARDLLVGTRSLEISGGIFADNISSCGLDVKYGIMKNRNLELGGAVSAYLLQYDINKEYRIPLVQALGSFVLSYRLIGCRHNSFALWADCEAALGYESVNWNKEKLPDGAVIVNKSCFLYGIMVSCRLDIPLGKKISMVLKIRERCMPSSSVQILHTDMNIGLKFNIN